MNLISLLDSYMEYFIALLFILLMIQLGLSVVYIIGLFKGVDK